MVFLGTRRTFAAAVTNVRKIRNSGQAGIERSTTIEDIHCELDCRAIRRDRQKLID
jgi:hypothetical protein